MSKFLGVGGKDYTSGVANVASVNDRGEVAVENVLGKNILFDKQDFVASETSVMLIPWGDIPKGAAYYGIYVSRNHDSRVFNLMVETTVDSRHFSQPAGYLRAAYKFKAGGEAYIIRPFATDGFGSLRITFENGTIPGRYSAWIMFYRDATPVVVGEEEEDIWEDIRTFETTVGAHSTVSSIGIAGTGRYSEVVVTVRTDVSHEFSLNTFLNSEFYPIVPRGKYYSISSDVFQAPASGGLAPHIRNYSDSERTYTITVKARK